jgi:hypothetical protein
MATSKSSPKHSRKMNLQSILKKEITIVTYLIGIGQVWCTWKAYEISNSLSKKIKKNNRMNELN